MDQFSHIESTDIEMEHNLANNTGKVQEMNFDHNAGGSLRTLAEDEPTLADTIFKHLRHGEVQ